MYTVNGTTDAYGQISNPNTDCIPIAAADQYIAITGNSQRLRVINAAQAQIELLKNEKVDFVVIAIKKSALTNV